MTSHALAVNSSDGWETVPRETNGLIRGKILKFREGEFVLDKQSVVNGASFVVEGVAVAWVKWIDRLPQEHRVTQSGQQHPYRDDLPDQDQDLWEAGLDGKPADPWKDTRYVYLIDRKTAEEVTFVTDSAGGRNAVGDLKSQIAIFRAAHPGAAPIVELAVGKWQTKYGLKSKPLFKVTGWIAAADRGDEEPLRLPRHDLEDDIPF